MNTTLIVAKMAPESAGAVADVFSAFDATDMPHLMGTRRRELFYYHGLYFHVQNFDGDQGPETIQGIREHPRFVQISEELKNMISPYDPDTWRSPKDAMATRFYHWSAM